MPMIQQIDAGALIDALRAGREDRYNDEQRRSAGRRAQEYSGLVGQLYGGGNAPTGGLAGQYAPTMPAQPPSFGKAFGPDTQAALGSGAALPALPETPPQQQQAAPAAPQRAGPDPDILFRMVLLDHEQGGKLVTALKGMDEMQLKRQQANSAQYGAAAHYIRTRGRTREERAQLARTIVPQLQAQGIEVPQQIDLSDNGLMAIEALAHDLDTTVDNELAQREQDMGKQIAVPQGGSVLSLTPDGSREWIVGGGGPGGSVDIPRVSTPEEAGQLAPGTRFMLPDGRIGTVPGGGSGDAAGSFP